MCLRVSGRGLVWPRARQRNGRERDGGRPQGEREKGAGSQGEREEGAGPQGEREEGAER